MFLRKKESKNAPAKLQKPPRAENTEAIIFEKEALEEQVKPVVSEVNTPQKEAPKEIETPQSSSDTEQGVRFSFPKLNLPDLKVIKESIRTVYKKKHKPVKEKKASSLLKQFETDLQLVLVPLILLAILAALMIINNYYIEIIADNSLPQVESVASIQPFPLADTVIPPDISAKAAIVLDADSQVILLGKNEELRFSMASTTKIMTALTALDYFKDEEVLTVKSSGVDGSVIGLSRGEKLTFNDLLYAMLLPSANDAAVAIADNYPEGREAFVKKMNDKALLLHLTNTHFADPTGLDDDENYTTVIDLARLGSHAMKNKTFAQIVGTQNKVIFNTSYSQQYALANLNRLLGTKGVNGIKTGTTEGAGEVLVTSKVANGHTYIIVVMNSTDRFEDTNVRLDCIDEKVKYVMPPRHR